MNTLSMSDFRELNIQLAQENFYHYCSLLFPTFFCYHGFFKKTKHGEVILCHPELDIELPGLKAIEKRILLQYKNFDNLQKAIDKKQITNYQGIQSLLNRGKQFQAIRRKYLYKLCNNLQAFYENRLVNPEGEPYQKLMVNLPPRTKKTLTFKLFSTWIFGQNPHEKIFAISYGKGLSVKFGKDVRDIIQQRKTNPADYVFSDIFPEVKIKRSDSAKECWSLEDEHFSFLSTSPASAQTGIGFNYALIDDLVKDAKHFYTETRVENDWEYLGNTLLNRKENSKSKIVVIMHRWGLGDICDRILKAEGDQWAVIKFPAYNQETDCMLDPEVMDKEDFFKRKTLTNPDIWEANYMQNAVQLTGYLYGHFTTYSKADLPEKFEFIGFYLDTADQGTDYLCGGFFGFYKGLAYMLRVIYTQLNAEITENEICDTIIDLKATTGYVESNSGGHGYARNMRRILKERKYYICTVNEFTQGENKVARILSNRTGVTASIIMPENWAALWPEFHKDITTAKIKGAWTADDGMDTLTGIFEKFIDYTPLRFS